MSSQGARPERPLFPILTGLFVASLIVSNVTSQKIFAIGPFTFPGGVILFPIVFIFNDILTEVYGYYRARIVIWTGFAGQVLAALIYIIVGLLPPAEFWQHQDAYDVILGFIPRIVLASIVAYFCGELANSFVLSKMKYWSSGKRGLQQAWRFVASTVVGEGVDSAIFMLISFIGVLTASNLLWTTVSLYLFKVAYEVIALPFSTRFADWVKKYEGVDHIDYPDRTNYNPFILFR